ncbi:MAG: type II toxin-antitoxin system VapC family toxin [Thermoguttaceae bacterium]
MKYLLDTHVILWFLDDVDRLSDTVLESILEPTNEKCVSIVSVWELAIKISLGKLRFEGGVDRFIEVICENGFVLLPLKGIHIKRLENLPFLHRDPFDRILVASAIAERMCLVSADESVRQYNVNSLW